jgi:predicted lipoprotein with Yx(FWY)xxD motif
MMRMKLLIAAMILVMAGSAMAADMAMPGGVQARKSDAGPVVLADAKGMTLYTFDMDKVPGKSACNPDTKCSVYWPPLAAAADATPMGAWTVVTRDDGSKQWAYKDKPLYTFASDKKAGDTTGNDAGPNGTHIWHCALQ